MDFMRFVTKVRRDLDTVTTEPIPNRGHSARFVNEQESGMTDQAQIIEALGVASEFEAASEANRRAAFLKDYLVR
jgi:hypothetical protein